MQAMVTVYTHDIEASVAELLKAQAEYLHDRLIAPELRPQIQLRVIITTEASAFTAQTQENIARKKTPPNAFMFTIHHDQNFIPESLLALSREMISVAQLASGRYMLTGRAKNPIAHWLGVKLGGLNKIPLALRPWEVEAQNWQRKLTLEFLSYCKESHA